MKFSTRTRYGLRFLMHLASYPEGQLMQLNELAKSESISAGYLEQIVRSLKPMGIVRSVRGAAGGYTLACAPDQICIEQVFSHLEGDIYPVSCLLDPKQCTRMEQCNVRCFWSALDNHMRSFLRGLTLHDLMIMCSSNQDIKQDTV